MTSPRPPIRIEINPPSVSRCVAIQLFIHHLTLAVAYFEATQPEDLDIIRSTAETMFPTDEILTSAIPAFATHLNFLYRDEEAT